MALQGQVLDGPAPRPILTAQQQLAAVAEASGSQMKEAAAAADVTLASIKRWHDVPEYRDEVTRLVQPNAAQLRAPIQRMQKLIVEAAESAINTLLGALYAVDDKGDPKWAVRQKAAETLLATGVDVGKLVLKAGDAPAAHTQAVQINITREDGPPTGAVD